MSLKNNISVNDVYNKISLSKLSISEFVNGLRTMRIPQPFNLYLKQVDENTVSIFCTIDGETVYSNKLEQLGINMTEVYSKGHGYDKWATDRANRMLVKMLDVLSDFDEATTTVLDSMKDISDMRSEKFVQGTRQRPRFIVNITTNKTLTNNLLDFVDNIVITN